MLASSAMIRASLIGFILTPIIAITVFMQRYRFWCPCYPISCGLDRCLTHRYCSLLRTILKLILYFVNIIINCYSKIVQCCCSNQQRRMEESFYFKMNPDCENSINLQGANSVPLRRNSSIPVRKQPVPRPNSIARCNTNTSQRSNTSKGNNKWPRTPWKNFTSSLSGFSAKCKKTSNKTNPLNGNRTTANKHSFKMNSRNYPTTDFSTLNQSDIGNHFNYNCRIRIKLIKMMPI